MFYSRPFDVPTATDRTPQTGRWAPLTENATRQGNSEPMTSRVGRERRARMQTVALSQRSSRPMNHEESDNSVARLQQFEAMVHQSVRQLRWGQIEPSGRIAAAEAVRSAADRFGNRLRINRLWKSQWHRSGFLRRSHLTSADSQCPHQDQPRKASRAALCQSPTQSKRPARHRHCRRA